MIHDEIFIRVEKIFILLNMFALYGHTGQALLPKPYTQGPLISKIRYKASWIWKQSIHVSTNVNGIRQDFFGKNLMHFNYMSILIPP